MNINIQSPHLKITPELNDFVIDKVSKFTNFYNNIVSCDVILKIENSSTDDNKVCEIRLAVPGNDLFAEKQTTTFEESVASAVTILEKQLQKKKDKLNSL